MKTSKLVRIGHAVVPCGLLITGATLVELAGPRTVLAQSADVKSQVAKQPAREATLRNEALRITVQLPTGPGGFRGGTRFDPSGLVSQARVGRTNFLGHVHLCPDPWLHDAQGGLASEFSEPLGYDEAEPGQGFVKIGVGVLARMDERDYRFHHSYDVLEPGLWDVEVADDAIIFTQALVGPRGFAYRYVKTVAIDPAEPKLTIAHELENTGDRKIETRHYCHNFIRIKGRPVGPDYRLELGFDIADSEPPLAEQGVTVDGSVVTLDRQLPVRQSLFSRLEGYGDDASANRFRVSLGEDGSSVQMESDHAIDGLTLWAHPNALCPEPFVPIDVEPGETEAWTNTYTFTEAPPAE